MSFSLCHIFTATNIRLFKIGHSEATEHNTSTHRIGTSLRLIAENYDVTYLKRSVILFKDNGSKATLFFVAPCHPHKTNK